MTAPVDSNSGDRSQPDDSPFECELDRIIEEYRSSAKQGSPVSPEEIAARYPAHASALRALLPTIEMLDRAQGSPSVTPRELPATLGDFEILREVGHGGMGIVYEARQSSLGRRVALKVLGAHRVLPGNRERFEREARAVASLEHPHIVPVFTVGEADGIPFMAMRFIEGHTLATEIEARRREHTATDSTFGHHSSSSRSRSSASATHAKRVAVVGRDVARALAAAHEEGVLHRDIKPGNLILDREDKVWVTDFGLAKVDQAADLTESGSLVGTPRYMAPEAIHGWADPRTDVYGVGVTLYEFATGEPAFTGASQAELLRNIQERDPIRPQKRNPRIPRDLETIILTAMSRSPDRRYPTACALADDLDRFIQGQVIVARPATVSYRVGRFAQRHAVALGAVSLALAIVLAMALGWTVSLDRKRREAVDSQELAERNMRRAVDAVDRLLTQVADGPLAEEPGFTELRQTLLSDALDFCLEFLEERSDDPERQDEAFEAWIRLARIQRVLGLMPQAEQSARSAATLADRFAKEHGARGRSDAASNRQTIAQLELTRIARRAGKMAEAEVAARRALETARSTPLAETESESQDPPAQVTFILEGLTELATLLLKTGRIDEGGEALDECSEQLERAMARWPDSLDLEAPHLEIAYQRAYVAQGEGRPEDAAEALRHVRNRHRARIELLPRRARSEWVNELRASRALVDALRSLGLDDEANVLVGQIAESARDFARRYPDQLASVSQVASSQLLEGELERRHGSNARAEELVAAAVEAYEQCCRRVPDSFEHHQNAVAALTVLGSIRRDGRRLDAAELSYQRALEHLEVLARFAPQSVAIDLRLYDVHGWLGSLARQRDRFDDAEDHARRALAHVEAAVARDPTLPNRRRMARAVSSLGSVLRDKGDLGGASDAYAQARDRLDDLVRESPVDVVTLNELATVRYRLSLIEADRGNYERATDMALEVVELNERVIALRPGSASFRDRLWQSLHGLGTSYVKRELWLDAGSTFGRAADVAAEVVAKLSDRAESRRQLRKAAAKASECFRRAGCLEEALSWLGVATGQPADSEEPLHADLGMTAARIALALGPNHPSFLEVVQRSSESLQAAVRNGLSKGSLRNDTSLDTLLTLPAFDWLLDEE